MSQFVMDPDWLPFHPNPSKPKFQLPIGAVDAHCHVFGPGDKFPYAPERKYTPCDAGKEELWALRDYLGFTRNIIVQATCHGADNRALADALLDSQGLARGVATVRVDISDVELSNLNSAGVRGIRFNFVKRLVDVLPTEELIQIAHRVKQFGWHVVIYFESQDLAEFYDLFAAMPTTLVVDHMGRPDLAQPVEGADFDLFVRLMTENPNVWSKVTCPDRLSSVGPPNYEDFIPFAQFLIHHFPDRVLWGTDWPHPNLKSHMPDDGHLVDIIPKIASGEAMQHKLLIENPMRLYWPEEMKDF